MSNVNKVKTVMLLGDSIRMGYQPVLQKKLSGEFVVWGSEDNCRFAKYTLNELGRMTEAFLKKESDKCENALLMPGSKIENDIVYPDIIHWNNGLWDTSIVCEEDGAFTPIDEYLNYMSKILRELRKMTNKIIFATTTPVRSPNLNQKNDIITEYNKKITEFMEGEGVAINDLNSIISQNIDAYISRDNIHMNELGKEVCAEAAARAIRTIACSIK